MNKNLKAFLIYVGLALILTWPLLPNITTHYPSAHTLEGGDPNIYIWWMDAVARNIVDSSYEPSKMLFYPKGINFQAGYEGPVMLLVSTPIILLFNNPILAYNLVLLLAFILTAYCAYLLVKYLTESYSVSLVAGFCIGYSPYMMVRGTQHLDLLFLFGVLLVILYGLKSVEDPSRKNLIALVLSVMLTAVSAWYYLVGALIFLLILGIHKFGKLWEHKKKWTITIASMGLLLLIFAIPMLSNKSTMTDAYVDWLVDDRGADPAEFFVPHAFMQSWTWPVYRTLASPFESTSYFGIVGLIAIITLFLPKRFKIPNRGVWISTIVIFLLIAMGNYLHVVGWGKISLPFSLLQHIPPFDHLRSPVRFFIYSYIAMVIVFAYFLIQIKDKIKSQHKLILSVLLGAILLSERLILPYPVMALPVSEFYKALGQSEEHFAIADIPAVDPGRSLYNYYQLYHRKPIVDGEFTWTTYDQQTFDFIKSNRLLAHAFSNPCSKVIPLKEGEVEMALKHLADNNIRYVVVHNLLIRFECERLAGFFKEFFKSSKPVFTDGEITVYSTKTP